RIYNCPAARSLTSRGVRFNSDYAACGGIDAQRTGGFFIPTFNASNPNPSVAGFDWGTVEVKQNFASISDGLSNTIAAGEKQLHPLFQTVEGGDNEGWVSAGWDPDFIRWGSLNTADRNSGSTDMNGGYGGFQPNSMSIQNKVDLKAKYPTRT